eukprot:COSAG03_NODE_18006_length_363_cov_27.878788_1_plen_66_part_10
MSRDSYIGLDIVLVRVRRVCARAGPGPGGRPHGPPAQYLREIAVSCRQYCANPANSADYPRYYPVP